MPPINNNSFNQSQIDYAFDINADVEPVPTTQEYAIDYDMDDGDANDFDDLTTEDQAAISACKGLRRVPQVIEDLRPADTSKLEYSYRPLDNINQFWAGPSYWKFRKSRKMTIGRDASINSDASKVAAAQAPKRKNPRNKIEPIDISKYIQEDTDDDIFMSVDSRQAHRMKKVNSQKQKRWDPKKLKLPTDLRIDRNLFDQYEFCPGLPLKNVDPGSTPSIETSGYNYDNADDREYCSNMPTDDHDRDTDQEVDSVAPDEAIVPESEEAIPEVPNDQSVAEIGKTFEGAPEMVRIMIKFIFSH